MTRIVGLSSAEVPAYRSTLLPFVERAVQQGGCWYSAEEVLNAATNADMQVWLILSDMLLAVGVTEIVTYSSGRKVAWIFALARIGGELDFDLWVHHLDTIEAWARSLGCQSLALDGREGWARKLKGWSRRSVVLEKSL